MQRFLWPHSLETISNIVIDDKQYSDLFHQLTNVLRIKNGDLITLFNHNGDQDYIFLLGKLEKRSLTLQLHQTVPNHLELPSDLVLAQAIPQKGEKWEWILQKGTELGVKTFIPLITERTQKTHLPKEARMQKIVTEATEQCGRTFIPIITAQQKLNQWKPPQGSFFASLNSQETLVSLLQQKKSPEGLTFIIGPEGGFSPQEEQYLINQGAIPYSLGPTILRLETAALASLGIVSQLR